MAKFYSKLDETLQNFIKEQRICFIRLTKQVRCGDMGELGEVNDQ
jgi:hypothetical protein